MELTTPELVAAFEHGKFVERNDVMDMIRNILKTNQEIDNLPSRLVLQVLLASLIVNEEEEEE